MVPPFQHNGGIQERFVIDKKIVTSSPFWGILRYIREIGGDGTVMEGDLKCESVKV